MSHPDFSHWASSTQQHMEVVLAKILPRADLHPSCLHDAMRYAVLGGGKRIRPLLVFASGQLTGAPQHRLDYAAAAVELIHAYSLVHDDLPCMDNDALRRGKPTVHVQYDQATALLVGDALQTLAFDTLAAHEVAASATTQLTMLHLLAKAAGSCGMAGGQAVDLASVGQSLTLPELEQMHILKTGALIRASVLLGAHAGEHLPDAELARLDHFAKCVGLAFQVVDDVLDAESSSATLGKTVGKDAKQNKPTYVALLGAKAAKALAEELCADAIDSLSGFGDNAKSLRELANFIVHRAF